MVEGLRSHFRLLAIFVGFSDCFKASVESRRSHVKRLRFIQSLTHPDEFLQVELEGVVACGKTKKTSGIHGAHDKAVRLAPVIELIDRDHPPAPGLLATRILGFPEIYLSICRPMSLAVISVPPPAEDPARSEERRVGKERRW